MPGNRPRLNIQCTIGCEQARPNLTVIRTPSAAGLFCCALAVLIQIPLPATPSARPPRCRSGTSNISNQDTHLTHWSGIHPKAPSILGSIREGRRSLSRRRANVWVHSNQAGTRDLREREPFLLATEEGIAIYPDDGSNYPRLPLLGLGAIVKNNLKLVIDGNREHVSLTSPSW